MNRLLLYFALSTIFLLSTGANSFAGGLKGKVRIDGSSTVFPITEAVAENFKKRIERSVSPLEFQERAEGLKSLPRVKQTSMMHQDE